MTLNSGFIYEWVPRSTRVGKTFPVLGGCGGDRLKKDTREETVGTRGARAGSGNAPPWRPLFPKRTPPILQNRCSHQCRKKYIRIRHKSSMTTTKGITGNAFRWWVFETKANILTFHRTALGMLRSGESNTVYSAIQSVVSFLNLLPKPEVYRLPTLFIRFSGEYIKYSRITKIPLKIFYN